MEIDDFGQVSSLTPLKITEKASSAKPQTLVCKSLQITSVLRISAELQTKKKPRLCCEIVWGDYIENGGNGKCTVISFRTYARGGLCIGTPSGLC